MKETTGDLWDYPADATIITTNGTVKNDLFAVMGRGCAREACQRYPGMEKLLGHHLMCFGNQVYCFQMQDDRILITFPVKHNWYESANIDLIRKSCFELDVHMERLELESVVMPRPGCGNGKLDWKDVKPVIEPLLDDRYTVITWT